jgi:hypothetical protein
MFEYVGAKHHIDAGIREWKSSTVEVYDRKNSLLGIGTTRKVDSGNPIPARLK